MKARKATVVFLTLALTLALASSSFAAPQRSSERGLAQSVVGLVLEELQTLLHQYGLLWDEGSTEAEAATAPEQEAGTTVDPWGPPQSAAEPTEDPGDEAGTTVDPWG